MGAFSFLESAFTPAGTNARRGQENQIRGMSKRLQGLFDSYIPLAQKQIGNQGRVLDSNAQLIQDFMGTLGESGRRAGLSRFNSEVDAQGVSEDAGTDMGLGAAGVDAQTRAGVKANARRGRASAKNKFFADTYDPTNIAARLSAGNNAIGGYLNNSGLPINSANSLFGSVNGQQPVQVQPGLGDYIGQAAASYAGGMGAGKAGKK